MVLLYFFTFLLKGPSTLGITNRSFEFFHNITFYTSKMKFGLLNLVEHLKEKGEKMVLAYLPHAPKLPLD